MKIIHRYPAVTFLLAIIVIGSALLDYFVPVMGDDLIFLNQLGLDNYTRPDRSTVSFILAHIFGCNGRLFDYMGPVIIDLLPRALASAVMGGMAGLFFYSVLYACRLPRHGYQTLSIFVIAFTLATMPWWDGMYLHVCQFNYLWGTTFCLLFIGLFFHDIETHSRIRITLIFILGVFAGASHEQTGVSMCGAFFFWLITCRHYRDLSDARKYMLAGLITGTLIPIVSPALWNREAQGPAGQTMIQMLLTTLPLLSVLLIIIVAGMLSVYSRRYILTLARGEWGVTVCAAVLSAIIALISGIPGRTGFFPEAASIVAMTRMVRDIRCHIPRPAALTASSFMIVIICTHFLVSILQQKNLKHEFDEVLAAYMDSADGIVYYDFTDRYDVSPLTLLRIKGVADADDYWNLHAVQEAYGTTTKRLVILPTSFSGRLDSMTDSVSDGKVTVYSNKPGLTVVTLDDVALQYYPGPSPRVVTATRLADGREIWTAIPRVHDPGDYNLPVKSPF